MGNVCRKSFLLILTFSTACFAQFPLSFGIKGGVPLTDAIQNTSATVSGSGVTASSTSKDYVIGPTVELRLPFHLAVEADALYRAVNVLETTSVRTGFAVDYKGDYGSWEIPVVAKYRFGFPVAKPYVEAGPSFRTTAAQPLARLSSDGFVLGLGVDFHLIVLHLSPEFRYTRWGSDSAPTFATTYISSNQNQVEFLVGLSF
jgi:hypothetical protein